MGLSPHGWFLLGKILLKMDDDWGYPYDSGNPPYSRDIMISGGYNLIQVNKYVPNKDEVVQQRYNMGCSNHVRCGP